MPTERHLPVWVTLSGAATLIDVSKDTILRRAMPWQDEPVRHRIRFKLLVLDEGTRQERRYLASDVERLLSPLGVQVSCASEPSGIYHPSVIPKEVPQSAPEPKNVPLVDGNNDALKNASKPTAGSRLRHVESGIYQDIISRTYFERPHINGKRTNRSLKAKSLKLAREELHRRRAAVSAGKNPYVLEKSVAATTVGDVIRLYQHDQYPDKHLNPRPESTQTDEKRNCDSLLLFWNTIAVDSVSLASCDRYRDWRVERVKRGKGLRTIDCELNTLNSAFRYAVRRELVSKNPLVDRPRYQPSKMVVHCRQFMPGNADELHAAARHLFSVATSEVFGFQLLFTAYTGQRTCELLRLRTDAGPDEPGHVLHDGSCLRVWRAKGQDIVNPFCAVHEGLRMLLDVHKRWLEDRYPNSPWFFPGRSGDHVVDKNALSHALRRLKEKGLISRKLTPHGGRAFFVTVRRSHGSTDSQIALEIGHTSRGSTLSGVYGGVPPDWLRGGGPKMAWLPVGAPAWSDLLSGLQKVSPETAWTQITVRIYPGMYPVKLIKVSASPNPVCPPGDWGRYEPGKLNYGESLPVDYEIIGIIQSPPTVGQCMRVHRINRNGVSCLGEFISTEVVELTEDGFKTLNSVYRLVVLPAAQSLGCGGLEMER